MMPWEKYAQQAAPAQPAPGPWTNYRAPAGSGVGGQVGAQLAAIEQAARQQMLLGNDAGYNALMQQAFALRNDLKNGTTFVDGQMAPIPGANMGAYARSQAEAAGTAAGQVPSSVQEYQFAVGQGFDGSFGEWEQQNRRAGATTVNVGGEGDKFYEVTDTETAKRFAGFSDAGHTARRNKARIDRLDGLLQRIPTGGQAAFLQMAGDFGINSDGLDDIQAASAIISSLVPEQREPGSGSMSDTDLAGFKLSLPRIINQPGGNQLILGTMRAIADYDIAVGDIADAVADRAMTPSEGRAAIRELSNPLADYGDKVDTLLSGGASAPSQTAPAPGGMLAAPAQTAPAQPPVPVEAPGGMLGVPTGGADGMGSQANPHRPTSAAEYGQVPSGAFFVHSDGSIRQKP